MTRQYFVIPKDFDHDEMPPSKLELLHLRGANEENADIVGVENGIEVFRAPYDKRLEWKLDAELPSVPVTKVSEEGEEEERLGEPEPPEIRKGKTPLFQLLYKECDGGMKRGEIHDLVFDELRWFERTGEFIFTVDRELEDMVGDDFLAITREGEYHSLPADLDLEDEGYDIETGVYPLLRLIRDTVAERGSIEIHPLIRTIHDSWSWTSSRSVAEFWIQESVERGFIREVERNRFEPYKEIR